MERHRRESQAAEGMLWMPSGVQIQIETMTVQGYSLRKKRLESAPMSFTVSHDAGKIMNATYSLRFESFSLGPDSTAFLGGDCF